jgi:hypothetical protein
LLRNRKGPKVVRGSSPTKLSDVAETASKVVLAEEEEEEGEIAVAVLLVGLAVIVATNHDPL